MIKLIREGSRKYPWILITLMGMIVVAFIVGMGWWGYGDVQAGKVAVVGDHPVTLEEYKRMYRKLYDYYRDNVNEEVKDDEVRQMALESLINTKLWLQAAEQLGLTVTPAELRAEVVSRREFQKDGRFDPILYRRLLLSNRLTPALYEILERERLLAEKAQTRVMEAVALTPAERQEALTLMASVGGDAGGVIAKDVLVQNFLYQKRQRALRAYTESLKTRIPIEVYRENM